MKSWITSFNHCSAACHRHQTKTLRLNPQDTKYRGACCQKKTAACGPYEARGLEYIRPKTGIEFDQLELEPFCACFSLSKAWLPSCSCRSISFRASGPIFLMLCTVPIALSAVYEHAWSAKIETALRRPWGTPIKVTSFLVHRLIQPVLHAHFKCSSVQILGLSMRRREIKVRLFSQIFLVIGFREKWPTGKKTAQTQLVYSKYLD